MVGTVLVALLVGRITANEFGRFVADRNQQLLASELSDHYQTHGNWDGVVLRFPDRRQMGGGAARGAMMTVVDNMGRVVIPGGGRIHGEKVPPSDLDRGVPIQVGDRTVGTLIIGPNPFRPEGEEGLFLSRVNNTLILASIGATLAALFLGFFLARALTQPLRELTTATRTVAAGELGHQVEVRSQDELGELAAAFNQMSTDLARSRDLRRQMTADIAHDLRTPLSVILGHAEALRDGVLPPTAETVHIIHDEALRLNRLVDDLRTLSLAEANELSLNLRLTHPKSLLEQAVAAQTATAQKQNISLEIKASSNLPQLNVDPDRMAQLLNNVLENGLRHTPPGGHISLNAEPCAGGVRLSIWDTGPGIAAEDLTRIFDRFYKQDKSRGRQDGGSGLGLAIARSIVTRHNGRIWAESEPGQGATILIELPVHQNDIQPLGEKFSS
jgi:signal transduction histidine kinase